MSVKTMFIFCIDNAVCNFTDYVILISVMGENVGDLEKVIQRLTSPHRKQPKHTDSKTNVSNGHGAAVKKMKKVVSDLHEVKLDIKQEDEKYDDFPVLLQDGTLDDFPAIIQERKSDDFPAIIQDGKSDDFPAIIQERKSDDFPAIIQDGKSDDFPAIIQDDKSDDFPAIIEDRKSDDFPAIIQDEKSDDFPAIIQDEKSDDFPAIIQGSSDDDSYEDVEMAHAITARKRKHSKSSCSDLLCRRGYFKQVPIVGESLESLLEKDNRKQRMEIKSVCKDDKDGCHGNVRKVYRSHAKQEVNKESYVIQDVSGRHSANGQSKQAKSRTPKCCICQRCFKDSNDLYEHIELQHIECAVCKKLISHFDKYHYFAHKELMCYECRHVFKTVHTLRAHFQEEHCRCQNCKTSFVSKVTYQTHIEQCSDS